MLVLVAAVTVGIILALLFFVLHYTSMLGAHQEQNTAIQAASLKAASDLSLICINDPYFGYISLSDYAPVGTATAAQDNYDTPVQSINTILGTVRLDMIIADQVNDPTMKIMAQNDYAAALLAQQHLYTALQAAIQPSGTGTDYSGNTISPYQDAVTAYNSNQVRMSGTPSQMVANSMKLTLGSVVGAATCTVIPESPYDNTNSNQTQNTSNGMCYLAYVDIPYDNYHFVFSGISSGVKLVDPSTFSAAAPSGLSQYTMLSVVKAEADEQFQSSSQNASSVQVVHGVACAEPASANDPRPAPGALVISSPDGAPPITKFGDILTNPTFSSPVTFSSPSGGDYPGPGVTLPPAGIPGVVNPTVTVTGGAGLYGWTRQGGTKVRVSSVLAMLGYPLVSNGANGVGYIYTFTTDASGMLTISAPAMITMAPGPINSISQNQLYGVNNAPFSKNGANWDLEFADDVFQEGSINGGMHAGQPFATPEVDQAHLLPPGTTNSLVANTLALIASLLGMLLAAVIALVLALLGLGPQSGFAGPGGWLEYELFIRPPAQHAGGQMFGATIYQYPAAPATASRPTYRINGLDVEYRFRQVVTAPPPALPVPLL
jgi:hypothetical protein